MGQPTNAALSSKAPCAGLASGPHGGWAYSIMRGREMWDICVLGLHTFAQRFAGMRVAASAQCPLFTRLRLMLNVFLIAVLACSVFCYYVFFLPVTTAVRCLHYYGANDHSHLVLHTAILRLLRRCKYPSAMWPRTPAAWVSPHPPASFFSPLKPSHDPFSLYKLLLFLWKCPLFSFLVFLSPTLLHLNGCHIPTLPLCLPW